MSLPRRPLEFQFGGLMRRFQNDRSGVAAVEAAMVLPILMLVTFFSVEAGRLFYSETELTSALQRTARYALIYDETAESALQAKMAEHSSTLKQAQLQSLQIATTDNGDGTQLVQLSASYRFAFLMPQLTGVDSITLSAEERFLREQ